MTTTPQSLREDLVPSEVDIDRLSIVELAHHVRLHNYAYFTLSRPHVSDAYFDRLEARLRELDPDNEALREVGAPTLGAKIEHAVPMLSLEKCTKREEFEFWAEGIWEEETGETRASRIRVFGSEDMIQAAIAKRHAQKEKFRQWMSAPTSPRLVAMPKLDGVACSLRYGDSGFLMRGATRGDGQFGEDVTRNVRSVQGVPHRLDAAGGIRSGEVEVRGEVYLPLSKFAEVADVFANPRNLTAGVLGAKQSGEMPPDRLFFFAYDLLGLELMTERAKFAALRAMGFTPTPVRLCTFFEAPEVFEMYSLQRPNWDYEADGVVFKFDDVAMQQRLGITAHHPRAAIAWKFGAEAGTTSLIDVEWSVSRTGTITPVAIVAPVQLSGASVTRATLHNLSILRRLGLRIGDTVELVRRGGVIPHVERSHGGGTTPVLPPAECPSCFAPTREIATTRNVGGEEVTTVTLQCARPEGCTHARRGQLRHYCATLEMLGFGDKVIETLMESGLVNDPADLYTLTAGDLERLPHLGKLSAANLIEQVDKQRRVELSNFLQALGLPSLGKQNAEQLAKRWNLAEIRSLSVTELAELAGFGASIKAKVKKEESADELDKRKKTATRIVEALRDAAPLIDRLLQHVTVFSKAPGLRHSGPMAGQVVVFTGRLERMVRSDAQKQVVELGGLTGDAVTQDTTLLVVAADEMTAADPSSKMKKAKKLHDAGHPIEIIAEADFWARVEAAR